MEDLQGNSINEFIQNYRNAMGDQLAAEQAQINQQRANDFSTMMSNANVAGALYSNFPARDKIKYDTKTYYPALVKTQQTYQTGLDKLRSNAVNIANTIKSLQEKISDLNAV